MSVQKRISATDLDAYAYYLKTQDAEPDDEKPDPYVMTFDELATRLLRRGEPTDRMIYGTLFHSVIEQAIPAGYVQDEVDDVLFDWGVELDIPGEHVRTEVPIPHYEVDVDCEPVRLSGRIDGLDELSRVVWEFKTTGYAHGVEERYRDKMQWRVYLLATGYERAVYGVWGLGKPRKKKSKTGATVIGVNNSARYEFRAYDGMEDDVANLVREMTWHMDHELPEYWERTEHHA